MERWAAVGILALLLAATAPVASVAAGPADGPTLAQPDGFDETTFEITVYTNQSARWTFEYRRNLANQTEIDRFRDYAAEFEANRTALYRHFVNRSIVLAREGANVTGRNMTARAHHRSASVEQLGQTQGVVRMSFIWTDFAEASNGTVVIGDVFEGGIPIGQNQALVVHAGPSLEFASVRPDDYTASADTLAESDTITWFGEKRFADNRPHVEFQPSGNAQGPTTTGAVDAEMTGSSPILFAGLLLLVLLIAAAAIRQYDLLDRLPGGGDTPDGSSWRPPDTDEGSATASAEPELLTDRDRVLALLEEHGGRMKQVKIVEKTDWSKSKVSMLLTEMEDEGEVSKLRVGRENIVSLSGHEPDAAGSPFDEE